MNTDAVDAGLQAYTEYVRATQSYKAAVAHLAQYPDFYKIHQAEQAATTAAPPKVRKPRAVAGSKTAPNGGAGAAVSKPRKKMPTEATAAAVSGPTLMDVARDGIGALAKKPKKPKPVGAAVVVPMVAGAGDAAPIGKPRKPKKPKTQAAPPSLQTAQVIGHPGYALGGLPFL